MCVSDNWTAAQVVERWISDRGRPAAHMRRIGAFPILSEVYALADGGYDAELFGFHAQDQMRLEEVRLAGESVSRTVLIFAEFMMAAHEFGIDVATGAVITVCDAPFVVAESEEVFFDLYLAVDTCLWVDTPTTE